MYSTYSDQPYICGLAFTNGAHLQTQVVDLINFFRGHFFSYLRKTNSTFYSMFWARAKTITV